MARAGGGCRQRAWHGIITLRIGTKCRLLLDIRQYGELTTMASRGEVDLPDLGTWMTAHRAVPTWEYIHNTSLGPPGSGRQRW